MTQKRISKKPRQHVIQKRLLSNFSTDGTQTYDIQKVWMRNVKENIDVEIPLNGAGVLKDFLSYTADDRITEIEKECFPILIRIINQRCVFCRRFTSKEALENHAFLYRYLATQLVRTPFFRKTIKSILFQSSVDECRLREIQSEMLEEQKGGVFAVDYKMGRYAETRRGELAILYYRLIKSFSKVPFIELDRIAAGLFDITLPVFFNNKTSIPFIQNDIGLVPFKPLSEYRMRLFADGGEIQSVLCFPVDPTTCIHLCTNESLAKWSKLIPSDSDRGLLLDISLEGVIKDINNNLLRFADKFLFSNQQFKHEWI